MAVQRRRDLRFTLFPEDAHLDRRIRESLEDIKQSALPILAVVTVSRLRQGELPFEEYGVYIITNNGAVGCRVREDVSELATLHVLEVQEEAHRMFKIQRLPKPHTISLQFITTRQTKAS